MNYATVLSLIGMMCVSTLYAATDFTLLHELPSAAELQTFHKIMAKQSHRSSGNYYCPSLVVPAVEAINRSGVGSVVYKDSTLRLRIETAGKTLLNIAIAIPESRATQAVRAHIDAAWFDIWDLGRADTAINNRVRAAYPRDVQTMVRETHILYQALTPLCAHLVATLPIVYAPLTKQLRLRLSEGSRPGSPLVDQLTPSGDDDAATASSSSSPAVADEMDSPLSTGGASPVEPTPLLLEARLPQFGSPLLLTDASYTPHHFYAFLAWCLIGDIVNSISFTTPPTELQRAALIIIKQPELLKAAVAKTIPA